MVRNAWSSYMKWNEAIADVLFPETESPEPVYLDLEDEALLEIGARAGVDSDQAAQLGKAVANTLERGPRAFRRHSRELSQWSRGDRLEPPPILPVLAVLSLAAEKMAHGDGLVAHDFYGRLRPLLDLPPDDQDIVKSYRRVAERFWGGLNAWLNEWGGQRGLPSAFSLGHRYVGLPMSQALVRKTDRERLVQFFLRFGFSPGSDVTPSELETVLDLWMKEIPTPATRNLQRLWEKREARSRIAQAAAVALSAWDGRVSDSTDVGGSAGRIMLGLEMSGFPRKRFSIDVLLYADGSDMARTAEVATADGTRSLGLTPTGSGTLLLGGFGDFDNAGLLEGVIQVRDSHTGRDFTRRPKRLQVFRQDPISMRWLEIQQVLLGDDVRLVARADLLDDLETVLDKIARPGWNVVRSGYAGLPEDWAVVIDVEILAHLNELNKKMNDLGALLPLTQSQLKLAGGLALPGASRGKWHSWAPPEIRAITDSPGGFKVRLVDVGETTDEDGGVFQQLAEWQDDGEGLLLVDLAEESLGDGDYRLELLAHHKADPLTTQHFRLRSGDTPDLIQWKRTGDVSYGLKEPLGMLGVAQESEDLFVTGTFVSSGESERPLKKSQTRSQPWWSTERVVPPRGSSRSSLRIEPVPTSSCLYTGRHNEQVEYVPLDERLRPIVKFSLGTCKDCGLVRRYSTNYYKNRRAHQRRTTSTPLEPPTRDLHAVNHVRDVPAASWDLVLDGVMHTGGGPWALLERLAMHIDATGLFVDQFARSLEALGHIDIRRDPINLRPIHWEVSPSALATTTVRGEFLVGFWPSALTDEVAEVVGQAGGTLVHHPNPEGPGSWFFTAEQDLSVPVREAGYDVAETGQAWQSIAAHLPTLGELIAALPRQSADIDGQVKHFEVPAARWRDVTDLRAPGAYRVRRFSTLDALRTEEDVRRGQLAVSTVQLSKHGAALIEGHAPLLAYDPQTAELSVPIGADLPGLYGRAAVVCSGMLPVARGRLLIYQDVPRSLAEHLFYVFSH